MNRKYPVIEQKDCPGGLMIWMDKRLKEQTKELKEYIDERAEPGIRADIRSNNNQMWMRVIGVGLAILIVIFWIHLS